MKNNKGFMMAELVVVSAIVLTLLVTLFVSYNKIYSTYNTRISYYDNTTLYRLAYYRDILLENNLLNSMMEKAKTENIVNIYSNNEKAFTLPPAEYSDKIEDTVLLIYNGSNNDKKINISLLDEYNLHQTFIDYVNFITSSIKLESNYILLMERCNIKENLNIDDCKYAYLEIYDGYE